VVFLGTPFQGSHESFYTATQLRLAVAIQEGGEASSELLKYLRNDVGGRGELDELVQRFREVIEHQRFKFPMVCFYETQSSDFTKVIKDLPTEYAKQLNSDHTGIVSLHPRSMTLALTWIARSATFGLLAGPTPTTFGR
jgi:hypothetical protein